MKILGIIAEYNPFHNGHAFQLSEAKKQVSPDYTIACMSGDFLQRGEPALFDKYLRTRLALSGGIDAVFELPVYFSTSGADEFAACGVLTLKAAGATHLSFGVECDDIDLLKALAYDEEHETESFKNVLNANLENGMTYALAYSKALMTELKNDKVEEVLKAPNNRLAISYIKAVNKFCPDMKLIPIKRTGSDYNDETITGNICSASAIRHLFENIHGREHLFDELRNVVPESVFEILYEELSNRTIIHDRTITFEDFYLPLASSMLSTSFDVADMSESLYNRVQSLHNIPDTVKGIVDALKTRDITEARIKRVLLHILLGIQRSEFENAKSKGYINYLRLLGMRREAAPLIKCQRNCQAGDTIFIQKLSEGENRLKNLCLSTTLLYADIKASKLYDLILKRKAGIDIDSDYIINSIIM